MSVDNTELTREQARQNMKKVQKMEKQRQDHLNSMVTRREVYEMFQELRTALEMQERNIQLLHVQNMTILELGIQKGLFTKEEADDLSKEVAQRVYGPTKPIDPDPTLAFSEPRVGETNVQEKASGTKD